MHKLKPLIMKNAAPGKYADGGGLYFIKSTTGAKWIYRYSFDKKRREMGLGAYPDVSLAEARRARDKWADVLRDGRDPITARDQQRKDAADEMNRTDPLFEELAYEAFEAKKSSLRAGGKRGRWFSPIRTHVLPKLAKKRVSKITQDDILRVLKPIWKTKPTVARKVYQRTRMILKHGKMNGEDVDPFIVDAAVYTLGELKIDSQHIEAAEWQDIPAIYAQLDRKDSSHRALRLAILTAVRAHSIIGAHKDEFSGDVWTIAADRVKGNEGAVKDFRCPLSTQAQDEIASWISEADEGFLFPSPRGKHITHASIEKKLAKIEGAGKPHGLRTSFRTWVQDTESATFEVAETQLGHIIGNKVERSYARSDLLDQRRILMQKWADYVTGAEAKVVRLRG